MGKEPITGVSALKDLPDAPEILKKSTSFIDSPAFYMSVSAFLLGVMVIILTAYLIRHDKEPVDVLKALGIPLIVISAVLMVLTGFGSQEISPVIGLLGTIAGYLLGRAEAELSSRGKQRGGVIQQHGATAMNMSDEIQ